MAAIHVARDCWTVGSNMYTNSVPAASFLRCSGNLEFLFFSLKVSYISWSGRDLVFFLNLAPLVAFSKRRKERGCIFSSAGLLVSLTIFYYCFSPSVFARRGSSFKTFLKTDLGRRKPTTYRDIGRFRACRERHRDRLEFLIKKIFNLKYQKKGLLK